MLHRQIAELLLSQKLSVLATPRATRKFANIRNNPPVSLLLDNRFNKEKGYHAAKAVTVMGIVQGYPAVNSRAPRIKNETTKICRGCSR